MMVHKSLIEKLRRFASDDGGNIAIIAGIVMLPLMIAVGGGVDYGEALRQRDIMQQSVDAAALAAAPYPAEQRFGVAASVYRSNYPGPLANSQVAVGETGDGAVIVTAKGNLGTNFLRLIGLNELEIGASATAIASGTPDRTVVETVEVVTETYRTVCMLSLAKSGGNALLVNSPARVEGGDCDIHVRSTSNDAFMFNSNSTLNAHEFCVAGTATLRGSTNGTVKQKCQAAVDTIAGTLPQPHVGSCNYNNWTPPVQASITLQPGVYCGWTNFNGKPRINLMPGLYVIKDGGWNMNDGVEVTGNGVSFYLTGNNAAINMNGKMSWDMTAPRSGPYAGILYFQNPTLPANNFILNGQNGQRLEGLIYLPTQNVQFKSRSKSGTTDAVNIVANTFIINGESDWRFKPYDMFKINGSKTTTTVIEERETVIPGEPGAPYLIR